MAQTKFDMQVGERAESLAFGIGRSLPWYVVVACAAWDTGVLYSGRRACGGTGWLF
jgi:hypothetical protein